MTKKMPKTVAGNTATPPSEAASGTTALLYQLLETEMGGVQVYRAALQCAVNEDLRKEWEEYLQQTERHVGIARALLQTLGLDPDIDLPARVLARHSGQALVKLMLEALAIGTPAEAQLTAAECVVNAETKDHANWELVAELAKKTEGPAGEAMRAAVEEVEVEEDRHLYHTAGWARELWVQALGLPAVLPPPEETANAESAIAAAQAKASREKMV
jgi:rubrerythrin